MVRAKKEEVFKFSSIDNFIRRITKDFPKAKKFKTEILKPTER